jgi:hypothetical protein
MKIYRTVIASNQVSGKDLPGKETKNGFGENNRVVGSVFNVFL